MVQLNFFLGCGLALLSSLPVAVSLPYSCPDGLCPRTRANVTSAQMQRELGALISSRSNIYGPNETAFAEFTSRYQAYMPPRPQLVVQVGLEEDVAQVVCIIKH
jgi:hypothetical protein